MINHPENPTPDLAPMLKQLRLSGILDSLNTRNHQAIQQKMAYTDFLSLLISDEVARREQKKFDFRVRRAAFRSSKTLEQFDFDFNPTINTALIHDLTTCRFIHEKVCALIVGPCGTGKSHIAQAIGHRAIQLDHDVLFTTAAQMLGSLYAARAHDTFDCQSAFKTDQLSACKIDQSKRSILNQHFILLLRFPVAFLNR